MSLVDFFSILLFLGVSIHIISNKHEEPVSAVLWLSFLYVMNYWGIILYLFFGINRLKTSGNKLAEMYKKLEAVQQVEDTAFFKYLTSCAPFGSLTKHSKQISALLDRLLPNSPLLAGNAVKLYNDGTELYPEMLAAISDAKHTIHLCFYIVNIDNVGKELLSILNEKANEGVKVRLIYDRFGSGRFVARYLSKFHNNRSKNFKAKPFSIFNILAPYRLQLRNHRKLLIVDGETVFSGGINISSKNTTRFSRQTIHDIHCKITGPSSGFFQLCFIHDWYYANKELPKAVLSEPGYFPKSKKCGDNSLRVCSSGPGQNSGATGTVFMATTHLATKKIWIMTPYFSPGSEFVSSLTMAAARGVDVRILLPNKSDHLITSYAIKSYYEVLLKAGVKIFEKQGLFNHSKAMLVDDEWSFMGSSNCDNRSFKLNYELDFICEGGPFISKLHQQFSSEFSESIEITLEEHSRRSKVQCFLENISSLFSPVL